MSDFKYNAQGAVIVCPHVASKNLPIVYGCRDEPTEPADSGWQFLSEKEVDLADLKVWSVEEVLEYEPTLRSFIDSEYGTELWHDSVNATWNQKKS